MDKENLLKEMDEFLNHKGLYWEFLDFVRERGYTEEEVENILLD